MAENIAVLGDNESIKGFSAIGFEIFPCEKAEDSPTIFKKIAQSQNYAIIFVTEEYFPFLSKEIKKYANEKTPSVLPIPGAKNNNGCSIKRLSSFVEHAVGSDIIFNN